MKIILFYAILLGFSAVAAGNFCGCSIVQEIYLGDVEVNAPLTPPPTHITTGSETSGVKMSFYYSNLPNRRKISAATDARLTHTVQLTETVDYSPRKNNLDWNLSCGIIGANIDIPLGKSVALFGGFRFPCGNKNHNSGGNAGLGFHSSGSNPATRLDLGFNLQKYDYTATTIVYTQTSFLGSESKYVGMYEDRGSSTNINPFLTFTINSSDSQSPVNYFFTMGYFTQNLLGFNPGETHYLSPLGTTTIVDERMDCMCGFVYLNPGLTFSYGGQLNILVSAKLLKEMTGTDFDGWFILPSIQMDFQL